MKAIFLIILASLFLFGCQEEINSKLEEISPTTKEDTKKRAKETKKKKPNTKKQKQESKKKGQRAKNKGKQKKGKKSLVFLVKKMPVKQEKTAGYDRDDFTHWSDLDGNGCDTREDVLREENLRPKGSRCYDDRGLWYSVYDGVGTRDSSSFDVDHMVPLAEAYASGAWRWSEKKKEIYANDPYGPSLIAVSATSNREKSDGDPAEWLPSRSKYLCTYLKNWVLVKYRWRLAVDRSEKKALLRLSQRCPKIELKIKRR